MEDDVRITREDLNTWKTKILSGKIPRLTTGKTLVQRFFPTVAFVKVIAYPGKEGFAITIQDPVIKTRKLWEALFTSGCDQKCRERDKISETIENLLAGYSSQVEAAYLGRQPTGKNNSQTDCHKV